MSSTEIGRVKSPQGKSYEVRWDAGSRDIYVEGKHIGKATSAQEAMIKAEASVYDR